jgi:hypothetical protein
MTRNIILENGRGFNAYVIGQLKECAKKFFHKDIRVLTSRDLSNKECNGTGAVILFGSVVLAQLYIGLSHITITKIRI